MGVGLSMATVTFVKPVLLSRYSSGTAASIWAAALGYLSKSSLHACRSKRQAEITWGDMVAKEIGALWCLGKQRLTRFW